MFIVITFIISLLSFLFFKNKFIALYAFLIIFFLISPTAKILGLHNMDIYNLQISRIIVLFVLPSVFVLYLLKIKIIKTKIIKQHLKLFIIIFAVLVCVLFTSFIRNNFSFSNLNITTILNIWTFIIFFLFSTFFFSDNRISIKLKFKIMNKVFFTVLFFASFLALMTYLKIDIFYNIHKNYYNLFLGGYSGEDTLFLMVERYNRVYSILDAPNQFALFAVLMYIYFKLSKDMKYTSTLVYIYTIVLEFIILFTSQSRTGLLLYIIVSILIYLNYSFKKKVYLLPLLILIVAISIPFLPERVMNIFSIENFKEEMDAQRLFFWINTINEMFSSASSLLLGFIEKITTPEEGFHIENGYLQLIAVGGIGAFGLLISFLILLARSYQTSSNVLIKRYALYTVYIVSLSEMFMGSIFNVKISMVIGTLFGLYLSLIGKEKL